MADLYASLWALNQAKPEWSALLYCAALEKVYVF